MADVAVRPDRLRCRGHRSSRWDADMMSVIALVSGHDGPENSCVLVGKRHDCLLPAAAFAQSLYPLRDGVVVVFTGQHGSFGPLYQQSAQVAATALGDAAQAGFAAAGILLWRQSQPGAELGAVLELLEVTDRWPPSPMR